MKQCTRTFGWTTLLCGALLAAPGFSAEEAVMSPDAFQKQVEAAGGRVDFVFGDERAFAQCHASTVVAADTGDLVAAWFGGTEEKNPDVGIWLSRYENGAWTKPERAAKVNETAHWNPVLFRDGSGTIHLFFKVGAEIPKWSTWSMQSTDAGKTWSKAVELVPGDFGGRGPVKNKAIILSDGAWLAPASTEIDRKEAKEKKIAWPWKAFADRSEDQGKTWQRSAYWEMDRDALKGDGAIQPTFWESAPGKVHALMRSAGGSVWRVDSEDGGRTWSPVRATELPNNNSGIDLVRLDDGRLLLLYNPVAKNWGPRTPLDLALSDNNGKTWRTIAHLEDNPDGESEYSYPSIVRTKAGVALCYTWKRQRVRCWQIPASLLK
jgi:predicted neuraminidase